MSQFISVFIWTLQITICIQRQYIYILDNIAFIFQKAWILVMDFFLALWFYTNYLILQTYWFFVFKMEPKLDYIKTSTRSFSSQIN